MCAVCPCECIVRVCTRMCAHVCMSADVWCVPVRVRACMCVHTCVSGACVRAHVHVRAHGCASVYECARARLVRACVCVPGVCTCARVGGACVCVSGACVLRGGWGQAWGSFHSIGQGVPRVGLKSRCRCRGPAGRTEAPRRALCRVSPRRSRKLRVLKRPVPVFTGRTETSLRRGAQGPWAGSRSGPRGRPTAAPSSSPGPCPSRAG